ncbi:MAG: hypothetical protein ABIJ26_08185 [Candidatus Margulisiibacteriota bacterium]
MIFGLLFLLSPATLGKAGEVCNKTLLVLDDSLSKVRVVVGIVLIAAGLLIAWMAYPSGAQLWYLHAIAIIAVFFGVLYLAFPKALTTLSNIFNVILLPTDEILISIRKVVGIILIIASAYMLISSYLSMEY